MYAAETKKKNDAAEKAKAAAEKAKAEEEVALFMNICGLLVRD